MDEIREAFEVLKILFTEWNNTSENCHGAEVFSRSGVSGDFSIKRAFASGFYAAIDWYKKQPFDLWEYAPKESGKKFRLHFTGPLCHIQSYSEEYKGWVTRATLFNIDKSRDGEVRTYNPETKEFEV